VDLYIQSPIRLHSAVFNQLSTGTTLPLPLPFFTYNNKPQILPVADNDTILVGIPETYFAAVKNMWSNAPTPPYVSRYNALHKHRQKISTNFFL
jgi:hypothetical protein